MQLLGIRTVDRRWSWLLRGADGAMLLRSSRSFGSYALSMIDAAEVLDHLQTAPIEGADGLAASPPRHAVGRAGPRSPADRGRDPLP
ncbi:MULTISPECIES: hypothetical protein [unclassified Variovorax]|uniref:hypothetical protein n=1 Tax=unclassified Variovorax TaxID=663243 RepID=UPI00257625E7|nr:MULTISPECIES: hypothetical protein [unclassified Variovorax]MDM0089572.1 hypothetical protein [Variovorax sp. J22G40]MDM0147644.1 hypothetical protein [Variovorax sp. J2P1-31]